MALDELEIKDAGLVTRKIVGKYNASSQFQQGIHTLGSSRSDTYTTTANGTTVDVSDTPMSRLAMQVKQTSTVTSWTVVLQGSLDGTNFVNLITHTKVDNGDGAIAFSGASQYPVRYFRSSCTAITLGAGTNVIATIVGVP